MARIAVVDNDPDFLTYAHEALSDRGWDVLPCRDTLTAFEVVRREVPDIVLLDVRMETPRSGWDICDFLRFHPLTAAIPIVMCSADSVAIRERGHWLREHGIAVLHKPFDIDDLYATVEAALERRRAGDHGRAASSA